jgi:hypothetical protein
MSKVSKDEVMKALGQAQVQGMKEAVKEQAKEMGLLSGMMPGRANPVVTGAFEQVAQQATAVRLNIQRRDPVSGKMTYIRGPGEIDANLIASKGLPEIIDDWCGGGEYTVEVMAPGQERLMQNFTVGGAPQDPGYRAKTAVAGGVPVNQAYDPSHYFGVPRPMYAAQQDNSSNMAVKMMEIMMAKEMMSAKLGSVANAGQSSSEVQELRAELARMREDQKRSEEDRRRNEEMDRIRREAAEDRRKSEERFEKLLAEMNKDKTPAWMGLAQAALPAVAEVFKGKDATMGMLSNTFGTVLQAQQMAANQQAETFKMLMNRPSAADEISKMTGVFAQSQLTNLQTINQIVSSGLLDKGGGHPLVELLSQLIDQGGQVLQAGLSNKGGNGAIAGLEQEPAAPPLHIASSEPPQLTAPKDTQKQYDLNADPSFRVIIEQIKGDGNPREIALRLYRHGQPLREDQGHPLAKQWCRDPEGYSKLILGQLGVSAQRIEQITLALVDLALWVKDGRDPEEFAKVETRRRRRKRLIPSASPEMQASHGFSFVDPEDGEEVDDEEFDDAEDGEISDEESQQSMELIAEEAQAAEASSVAES